MRSTCSLNSACRSPLAPCACTCTCTLTCSYNSTTGAPPADMSVEVPTLRTLFSVQGASPQEPITNVTFAGLTFTGATSARNWLDCPRRPRTHHSPGSCTTHITHMCACVASAGTRPTFMDPRSNPSGGDWSLERSGAILIENSENVCRPCTR
jgi:hypothetical protein